MDGSRPTRALPAGAELRKLVDVRGDRGSLEMFTPVEHVLVTRSVGHMDQAMADQWLRKTEPLWLQPRPVAIFNEWELMESYESSARRALTDWVIAHRKQIEGAWFLTGSRMVAMGVATAGAATALVGVTLHASMQRAQWEGLLKARLAAR